MPCKCFFGANVPCSWYNICRCPCVGCCVCVQENCPCDGCCTKQCCEAKLYYVGGDGRPPAPVFTAKGGSPPNGNEMER